ncbi:MAG: hypothetical protein U1A78_26700 [Polyangia bacterium]
MHRLRADQIEPYRDHADAERDRALMRQFLAAVAAVRRSYPSAGPPGQPYRKPPDLHWFPAALQAALEEDWAGDFERADEAERQRREAARLAEPPRVRWEDLPERCPVDLGPLLQKTREPLPPRRPPDPPPAVRAVPIDLGPTLAALSDSAPPRRPPDEPAPAARERVASVDAVSLWRAFAENLRLPSSTLEKWFYPLVPQLENGRLTLYCRDKEVVDTFRDCYLTYIRSSNPDYSIEVVFNG